MCRRLRRAALRVAVSLAVICAAARIAASTHGVPDDRGVAAHRRGFGEIQARTAGDPVGGVSGVVAPDGVRAVAPTAAEWQPIRIAVFMYDLIRGWMYCTVEHQQRPNFQGQTVGCEAADVLTEQKRSALREYLVQAAVKMHEERLMVQPTRGNIVVDSWSWSNSRCTQFTIPTLHETRGVANADFVLYVAAGPASGGSAAWGATCQRFSDGRPSVGVVNLSPRGITTDGKMVRVIAHQVLHTLGFELETFRTKTMYQELTLRDRRSVPVVSSPEVAAQARAQYGCPRQWYMELEDTSSSDISAAHWKGRSAKDELMAGVMGAGLYSALTIAAMEDTGYYKGNYTKAEPMVYGQNAGCGLTSTQCVVKGVSQVPSMFCDKTMQYVSCTSDRLAMGKCAMTTHSSLPRAFQYFSNPSLGGTDPAMDYCPYIRADEKASCIRDGGMLFASVFGWASRCFETSVMLLNGKRQNAVCADTRCDASTKTYSVRVNGAYQYTPCPSGTTLYLRSLSTAFSGGLIYCPVYDAVCVAQNYTALPPPIIEETTRSPSGARGVTRCTTAVVALVALALVVL